MQTILHRNPRNLFVAVQWVPTDVLSTLKAFEAIPWQVLALRCRHKDAPRSIRMCIYPESERSI
jgi:hypothetical protein